MRPSILRLAQHRTPMIKFLGKRSAPKSVDHTPHLHPADPHSSLPDSFAESFVSYREQVQNPSAATPNQSSAPPTNDSSPKIPQPQPNKPYGLIGGKSGKDLGPVAPAEGEYFSRSELPRRFQPLVWEQPEIDAINSGGASFYP